MRVVSVRVVLATANPDKAREIEDLLDGFEVVARPASVQPTACARVRPSAAARVLAALSPGLAR